MKINNHIDVDGLSPTSKQPEVGKAKRKGGSAGSAESAQAGEKSQVSQLARQLSKAKEILDALPDVRSDRVAQAKARLSSGYYDTPEAREVLVSRLASLLKEITF